MQHTTAARPSLDQSTRLKFPVDAPAADSPPVQPNRPRRRRRRYDISLQGGIAPDVACGCGWISHGAHDLSDQIRRGRLACAIVHYNMQPAHNQHSL